MNREDSPSNGDALVTMKPRKKKTEIDHLKTEMGTLHTILLEALEKRETDLDSNWNNRMTEMEKLMEEKLEARMGRMAVMETLINNLNDKMAERDGATSSMDQLSSQMDKLIEQKAASRPVEDPPPVQSPRKTTKLGRFIPSLKSPRPSL